MDKLQRGPAPRCRSPFSSLDQAARKTRANQSTRKCRYRSAPERTAPRHCCRVQKLNRYLRETADSPADGSARVRKAAQSHGNKRVAPGRCAPSARKSGRRLAHHSAANARRKCETTQLQLPARQQQSTVFARPTSSYQFRRGTCAAQKKGQTSLPTKRNQFLKRITAALRPLPSGQACPIRQ